MFFKEPGTLARAKWSIKALKKVVHGDKPVWLDAKRDGRPAKLVHRVHEVLQSYENGKPDRAELEKDLPGKKVLRNRQVIGASIYGRWRWEGEGLSRYTDDERKHAQEWAAQE